MTVHTRSPLILLVALSLPVSGCDDAAPTEVTPPVISPVIVDAGQQITGETIGPLIRALAHDSARGRQTGTPALNVTAAFLAAQFEDAGLEPAGTQGYLQSFDLPPRFLDPAAAAVAPADGGSALVLGQDYFMTAPETIDHTGPLVWGGSTRDAAPGGGVDAQSPVVLLDHPGTTIDFEWYVTATSAAGTVNGDNTYPVGFVLSDGLDASTVARWMDTFARTRTDAPVFGVTEAAANQLLAGAGTDLATLRAGGPTEVGVNVRVAGGRTPPPARPANVVGVVRGSDASLRDTYIVVSAQYDHRGTWFANADGDSIYNGADDNASGTAALVEIARTLASLETAPRRSVLFLATADGTYDDLGAHNLVTNPTVDGTLVADINLDGIGRNDPNRIRGVGRAYSTMHDILLAIADEVDLNMGANHTDQNYFVGSDHVAFVDAGIPSIWFYAGQHEDTGAPTDEFDAVDTGKAARVARLALYLGYTAANDTVAVQWTDLGDLARADN